MSVRAGQLGVLLSSMSDKTAGMVLGLSAARVARLRAELKAVPEPASPPFAADFGCGPGVDPEEAMNHPPPAVILPVSAAPPEAAFVEAVAFQRAEIARVFSAPPRRSVSLGGGGRGAAETRHAGAAALRPLVPRRPLADRGGRHLV